MRNPRTAQSANYIARNSIARRARQARLAVEPTLTQDQLSGKLAAKGLTLDRAAIAKIESGRRCVFDFELPPLAEALKVDVRWLLGMQDVGGPAKKGSSR